MKELINELHKRKITHVVMEKEYDILPYKEEVELGFILYNLSKRTSSGNEKKVQLMALQEGIIPERYLDNVLNIGIDGQIKLLQSKVAVVGIGRLGSHIVENLARLGVGELLLVDANQISYKSLNSGLISLPEYINVDRTTIMSIRVRDINSGIVVSNVTDYITEKNVNEILKDVDIVVSSSNFLDTHILLSNYCRENNKVFIYGTLDGWNGYVASIFPKDKGFDKIDKVISETGCQGEERTALSFGTAIVAGYQTAELVEILTTGNSQHRGEVFKIDIKNQENKYIKI